MKDEAEAADSGESAADQEGADCGEAAGQASEYQDPAEVDGHGEAWV